MFLPQLNRLMAQTSGSDCVGAANCWKLRKIYRDDPNEARKPGKELVTGTVRPEAEMRDGGMP